MGLFDWGILPPDDDDKHPYILKRLVNIFVDKNVRLKSDGREFKCVSIYWNRTEELNYYRQKPYMYKCTCEDKEGEIYRFYPDALDILEVKAVLHD